MVKLVLQVNVENLAKPDLLEREDSPAALDHLDPQDPRDNVERPDLREHVESVVRLDLQDPLDHVVNQVRVISITYTNITQEHLSEA